MPSDLERWKGTLAGPLAAVAGPRFPTIERRRIPISLTSRDWTIWPAPPQTPWEKTLGQPLEGGFLRSDYVEVACRPELYTIKPHYELSTFDTFTVDPAGTVRVDAVHGLFPWTLGDDTPAGRCKLLEGVCAVTRALPERLADASDDAVRLRTLARQLDRLLEALQKQLVAEGIPGLDAILTPELRAVADRLWQWRLGGDAPR